MGDHDFGAILFEEAVTKGNFSPMTLEMYAFGVYLMHGGDPDNFAKLDIDQMQILITSYICTQRHTLDILFKMLKGVMGIKDD